MKVAFISKDATNPNFDVLRHYGQLLDDVEAGLSAMPALSYRKVVEDAHDFISIYWGHARLERVCERAGALQDLFGVVSHEKRVKACMSALSHSTPYCC